MSAVAITLFLSPPAHIEQALLNDPDFKGFLDLALKSGGEQSFGKDLSQVLFRIADPRLGMLDDLRLHDSVTALGQLTPIRELIAVAATVDRIQLVHSLWKLESFDEVNAWLKSVKCLLRLAYDLDGRLRGHLLLAEAIIPMVETVERKDYVLPNGDMASDAITRNLGIRAKVFALDRARRTPRAAGGNSIMDRLSRTLSKSKL